MSEYCDCVPEVCAACGKRHSPAESAPAPREEDFILDALKEARDNYVLFGRKRHIDYWNRAITQLAAERERADLLKLELDTAIASELEYRQKWLDEKDEVQNKTDLVRSMLIDAEAAEATLADERKEIERLREVTITECEDAVTTPIARKPENHPTWEIYQALEALRHTATFSSPPSGQEANNVAQSLKP